MKHALAVVLFLCASVCMAERTFYLKTGDSGKLQGPYPFKEGTSISISNATYQVSQVTAASNTFYLTSTKPAGKAGPFILRNGQRGILGNTAFQIDVVDRVGLCGFAGEKVDEKARRQGDSVTDLLFVNLMGNKTLELVERKDIKKALDEISLTTGRLTDPAQAVKLGKILGADYMVVGRLYSESGTNSVVAKVVEVTSGIIQEMSVFILKDDSLPQCAEGIGKLVLKAAGGEAGTDKKCFVAVGSFRDRSLTQLYLRLADDLRKSLEPHYAAKPGVGIVERSLLKPLLQEMGMNEQGMMAEGSKPGAEAQAAVLVVSGAYDVFRDKANKIGMDLQISRIGGEKYQEKIEGEPGDDLTRKISAILDIYLSSAQKGAVPDRKAEAKFQFEQGLRMSNLNYDKVKKLDTGYLVGYFRDLGAHGDQARLQGTWQEAARSPRHIANVRQAIENFESAIFLDPANEDARLCLGLCLDSRHIRDYQHSTPILEDLMKGATNERIRFAAAYCLWREDELKLSPELRKQVGEFPDAGMKIWYSRDLIEDGKVTKEQVLSLANRVLTSHCQGIDTITEDGKIFDRNSLKARLVHVHTCLSSIQSLSSYEKAAAFVEEAAKSFPRGASYIRMEYYVDYGRVRTPAQVSFMNGLVDDLAKGIVRYVDKDYLLEWLATYANAGPLAANDPKLTERICRVLEAEGMDMDKAKRHLIAVFRQEGNTAKVADLMKELGETEETPAEKAEKARKAEVAQWGKNRFELGKPLCQLDGAINALAQDADGNVTVIAWPNTLYLLKKGENQPKVVPAPLPEGNIFRCLAMNRDKIWVGTTAGIIEVDKTTKKSRTYTEKEGVLAMNVNDMCLIGDKLWVGLDKDSGYLDLKTSRFVGVKDMAAVQCMAPTVRDNLWFTPTRGVGCCPIRHLHAEGMKISDLPADLTANWECSSSLTANEWWVLKGTWRALGSQQSSYKGGVSCYNIQQERWWTISGELPNSDVLAVALAGNLAWVGGPGYIAIVDLPKAIVLKTCKDGAPSYFNPVYRGVAILRGSRGMWVGAGTRLFYIDDAQSPVRIPATETSRGIPSEPGVPSSTKWDEEARTLFGDDISTFLQNTNMSAEQTEILYSILDGRCKLVSKTVGNSDNVRRRIIDVLVTRGEVSDRQEAPLFAMIRETAGADENLLKTLARYCEKAHISAKNAGADAQFDEIFRMLYRVAENNSESQAIKYMELLSRDSPPSCRQEVGELALAICKRPNQNVDSARNVCEIMGLNTNAPAVNVRASEEGIRQLLAGQDTNRWEKIAAIIIKKPRLIDIQDNKSHTLLMLAARDGDKSAVEFLLNHGADPERGEPHQYTALEHAIRGHHTEIVKLLIQKGVKPTSTGVYENALCCAAECGDKDLVDFFLAQGVEIKSALVHVATADGGGAQRKEIAELLLAKGADINGLRQDRTALYMAVVYNQKEVAEFLLKKGADVNVKCGKETETVLQMAIRHESSLVGLLRQYGAKE